MNTNKEKELIEEKLPENIQIFLDFLKTKKGQDLLMAHCYLMTFSLVLSKKAGIEEGFGYRDIAFTILKNL